MLAHLHFLAHFACVPTEASLSYNTQDMVIDDPLGTIIVDKDGNPRRLSVRDRQTGSGMAFRSGDLTDTSR